MAQEYWFNTKTNAVMRGDDPELPRDSDLLGPYGSEEEASKAYETAAAKTAAWDAEDAKEREWETGDADADTWDNNPLNG